MGINILIVDDSSVMRTMILKTLRMSGIAIGDVLSASNGVEGLDILSRQWMDLVILDINMPVMNGEEMMSRMRANPETRDIPVIVISTEGSKTRIDELVKMGAKFIRKPFSPEMIRDVILQSIGQDQPPGEDYE
jgi:two-component system, chemotaxis family, chemotaxis protein CheY